MYIARLLIIGLLTLAIIVGFTPQAREQTRDAWQTIQPGVVEFMDSLYVAVRNMIVESGHEDQMDVEPGSPGTDFDRIVTMNSGRSF